MPIAPLDDFNEVVRTAAHSYLEDDQLSPGELVVGFDIVHDEPLIINAKIPRKFLVVAPTGGGKSILGARLADEYKFRINAAVDSCNDKKSEMRLKHQPNRLYESMIEYELDLLEDFLGYRYDRSTFMPFTELTRGWDNLKRFSPAYLGEVHGAVPFSFRMTDIKEKDWHKLLSLATSHLRRRLVFQVFYRRLEAERAKNPGLVVNAGFIRACADREEFYKYLFFAKAVDRLTDEDIESELEQIYQDFLKDGIFEGPEAINPFDLFFTDASDEQGMFAQRHNLVVDWSKHEEGLSEADEQTRDAYLALLTKYEFECAKIRDASGNTQRYLFLFDEAQKPLTTKAYPYTLNQLRILYAECRAYEVDIGILFQGEVKKVNDLLYENTDLFFISSKNANRDAINFLMESHPEIFPFKDDMREFIKYPKGCFLVIDKNESAEIKIIVSYPPRSMLYRAK